MPIVPPQAGMQSSWTVQLNSITVSGQTVDTVPKKVLIDTGNPGANLPKTLFESLYLKFNPVKTRDSSWLIDCSNVQKLPPITFNFAGAEAPVILTGEQQVLVTSDCTCMLIFSPSDKDSSLGSVFLSNFFSVFDYQSFTISLYQTNNQTPITCTPKPVCSGGCKSAKSRHTIQDVSYSISRTRPYSGSLIVDQIIENQ
jgi:hypothetical protein